MVLGDLIVNYQNASILMLIDRLIEYTGKAFWYSVVVVTQRH